VIYNHRKDNETDSTGFDDRVGKVQVPTSLTRTTMPRPSTGLLAAAGQERRVPLRGRINRQIASCCIARLLVLAIEDRQRPIITYIDSMGGSASEVLGVISTINGIRCPVVTFCHGQAVGPAAIIAAHGVKGFRVGIPSARFSFKGFEAVKSRDNGELDSLLPLLADILAADTRKSKDLVLKWFKDGAQFTASEALANGLIDAIAPQPLCPQYK